MNLLARLRLPRLPFLGTKETLQIPGPLVPDLAHPPRVTLRRGYDLATISWDPGRMHSGMAAWTTLHRRLEATGMVAAIDGWIEHHGQGADPQPERTGTARYDRVLHVPLDLADTLTGLVCGYLSQAVAAPLSLEEYTAHELRQSPAFC